MVWEEHASCAPTRPFPRPSVDPALPANFCKKVLNCRECDRIYLRPNPAAQNRSQRRQHQYRPGINGNLAPGSLRVRPLHAKVTEIRGAGTRRISAGSQPRETIVTPALTADTVVNDEEAVRIVGILRAKQSRVVHSPKRLAPTLIEEVALCEVARAPRHQSLNGANRASDRRSLLTRRCQIRLAICDTGNGRWAVRRTDEKGKRIEHLWIRRGILRCRNRLSPCARKTFVDVQCHAPMTRAGK